jgi:hypothetical protein
VDPGVCGHLHADVTDADLIGHEELGYLTDLSVWAERNAHRFVPRGGPNTFDRSKGFDYVSNYLTQIARFEVWKSNLPQ